MAQKKTIIVQEPATLSANSSLTQSQANMMKAAQQARQAEAVQLAQAQAAKKTTTTASTSKPASNPPATSQFSSKVNVGQATTTPKNAATTVPTVAVVDTMPARTISTPSTATTTTVYTGNSLNVAPPQNTDNKTSGGGDKGYTPPVTYEEPTPTVPYTAPSTSSSTPSSSSSSNYTYSGSSYTPTRAAFEPSAAYYKAMEETQRLLEQLKGGRTSYTDKINDALKGIETNPAFAYDFNTDPLFQSALASAMRSGQSAMQNTMGQAAALTGGYGNTYGQSVGNQAYNQYIQGAYDNLPDYYNLARNAYDADLANKYNLLNQYRLGDESEYERMYNDWKNQYTMANDQYAKEYENYWQEQGFNEDSRRFLESIRQYDNDFNFKRERADVDDAHWDKTFDYNAYRDSVSDDHWDKQFNYNAYRDSVSDSHWDANYNLSKSAQDWEQQYKEAQQKQATEDATKASQTVTYKEPSSSEYTKALDAYNTGGQSALEKYVDTLSSNIDIQKLYDYILSYGQKNYSQRNYTNVKDTVNWFGGLDNNDIVADEYGNQYSLIDLARLIAEEEKISLEEAKDMLMKYNKVKNIVE